jgi:hypothetical protein
LPRSFEVSTVCVMGISFDWCALSDTTQHKNAAVERFVTWKCYFSTLPATIPRESEPEIRRQTKESVGGLGNQRLRLSPRISADPQ